MRARIIFRGLTIFSFENESGEATKDSSSVDDGALPNLGTMTAWLVSDRKHATHPLHNHTPLWGFIGRDYGSDTGPGNAETKLKMPDQTRIELVGYDPPDKKPGVRVHGSFLGYVPRFADLDASRTALQILASLNDPYNRFVTKRVVIPAGTVRAGEFVSWDWYGTTPARVGFMDTMLQGFISNEVVVDIGDDSDLKAHDPQKYLSVSDAIDNKKFERKLWARSKTATDDDIHPNLVELKITNLPAKRALAVPWGLHIFTAFDAAGFTGHAYSNDDQVDAFLAATVDYADEWAYDANTMGVRADAKGPGYPFPFLINPKGDKRDPLAAGAKPMAVKPPRTPGRQPGDFPPPPAHGSHGSHEITNDPGATEICPFIRI